ncbi:MAG: hypothetical protein AAF491_00440 [Verrucomicrobiota bacterium]
MNPPSLPSLPETTAMMRGESPASAIRVDFPIDGLQARRLTGLLAAPGHSQIDSDAAWAAVVRSWWSLGLTWGMAACAENGELAWNLITPQNSSEADQTVNAHLTGSQWESEPSDFRSLAARLGSYPYRFSMAGHSGCGPEARPEHALRDLLGRDFMFLVLAKAASRTEIESFNHEWECQHQFLRDEHLARPGLERDSHAAASTCLSLIEAACRRGTDSLREGGWLVRTIVAANDQQTFDRARALLHGAYSADGGEPEPLRWQSLEDPRKVTFLSSSEAAALARPPRTEVPGFLLDLRLAPQADSPVVESDAVFSNAPPVAEKEKDATRRLSIGRVLDDAGNPGGWLEIPADDLCRHLLVAGMTGSGKSVTCEHLLISSWSEHHIPWLVIEPGLKTGYRRLLNSEIGKDLCVWSVGDPRSKRLPLNPMAVPAGVGLAEHCSALFSVIASAFELVAPMPEVLAAAIEETYRKHGWDLAGEAPASPPPTLEDLVAEVDRSTRELGYGPEIAGNIRAGLLLRLSRLLRGPLAPELGAKTGLDMADITRKPTVIELSRLPDAASQALVMGLITLQLRHFWQGAGQSDSLRHIVLLEEAHRLLKVVPETASNAGRVRATEDIAQLLAEMRGLGIGLIIVDQTPSELIHSAIANTGTKILHRLDHADDRELAGRAAGLPADRTDLLGALPVGEAILRTSLRPKPFRLRLPNPTITYGGVPMPDLSPAAAVRSKSDPCPECGQIDCAARTAGAERHHLQRRLVAMERAASSGTAVLREWAHREVTAACPDTTQNVAHLCFTLSLGATAGLSDQTLAKIREAFLS